MRSLLKSRRAISPVIATVILVAVTIVVAVSVAYWMGSISASYTTHEQVEMPFAYPEYVSAVTVTGEVVGTGDGTKPTFTATLTEVPIKPTSVTVTAGAVSLVDTDGVGTLVGTGGSGTIDYATGAISVTFTAPPTVAITADYVAEGLWKIQIELKNTGSADAAIDNILVNDKPLNAYPAGSIRLFKTDEAPANEIKPLSAISVFVNKGTTVKVIVWLREGVNGVEGCNHGVSINMKLHSAKGLLYPLTVKLP